MLGRELVYTAIEDWCPGKALPSLANVSYAFGNMLTRPLREVRAELSQHLEDTKSRLRLKWQTSRIHAVRYKGIASVSSSTSHMLPIAHTDTSRIHEKEHLMNMRLAPRIARLKAVDQALKRLESQKRVRTSGAEPQFHHQPHSPSHETCSSCPEMKRPRRATKRQRNKARSWQSRCIDKTSHLMLDD